MMQRSPSTPPAKALVIWFVEEQKHQKYDPLLHEKQVAWADRIIQRGYSASEVAGCIAAIRDGSLPLYGDGRHVTSLALLLAESTDDGKTLLEKYRTLQRRRAFASRPAIAEAIRLREGGYFALAQ